MQDELHFKLAAKEKEKKVLSGGSDRDSRKSVLNNGQKLEVKAEKECKAGISWRAKRQTTAHIMQQSAIRHETRFCARKSRSRELSAEPAERKKSVLQWSRSGV